MQLQSDRGSSAAAAAAAVPGKSVNNKSNRDVTLQARRSLRDNSDKATDARGKELGRHITVARVKSICRRDAVPLHWHHDRISIARMLPGNIESLRPDSRPLQV